MSLLKLSVAQKHQLSEVANKLVASGCGILAADESTITINKYFESISLENTEENRRLYRALLLTCDESIKNYLGGVLLLDETLHQKDDEGKFFRDYLKERDIAVGVKVDTGVVKLTETMNEMTAQGLDDLSERCANYKALGCEFAKWRCVFTVSDTSPSPLAIAENANVLARYAAICQMNEIVPIIEPEILPNGRHRLEKFREVTEDVLSACYRALHEHHVYIEGTMLKLNMVTPGYGCPIKYSPEQIATSTVVALRRTVPPAVPGIVFLSQGQSELAATLLLNAINISDLKKPWPLSFSYDKPLQDSVLKAWQGKTANVALAQDVFLHRSRMNWLAAQGQYEQSMELPGNKIYGF